MLTCVDFSDPGPPIIFCEDSITKVISVDTGGGGCTVTADFSYINSGGNTVDFTDLSTGNPNNPNFWSWTFGDGSPLSNLQNPSYTYSAPGNYTVILHISDPFALCSDSIQKIISIDTSGGGTGIGNLIKNVVSEFGQLYPNPVSDNGMMNIVLDQPAEVRLTIWNTLGQAVYNKQFELNAGANPINMDLSGLAVGLYYTRIIANNDKVYLQKFVKQ